MVGQHCTNCQTRRICGNIENLFKVTESNYGDVAH